MGDAHRATRVLIVEDNTSLALGIRRSLEAAGFQVEVAEDASTARSVLLSNPPDLMVLDLMLPGTDGFEVLRDLRAAGCTLPVLILSARGQQIDKLRGFRMGADDYVVKPVGVMELIARVEAILRRSRRPESSAGPPALPDPLVFGDIGVHVAARTVERDGLPVELTPREFDLLLHLLRAEGAAVPRRTLLRDVWGYKRAVPTRTIDTHIANLRGKLERDPSRPRHILTVRKVGYRLAREPSGSRA